MMFCLNLLQPVVVCGVLSNDLLQPVKVPVFFFLSLLQPIIAHGVLSHDVLQPAIVCGTSVS